MSPREPEVQRLASRAEAAMAANRPAEALGYVEAALSIEPRDAHLLNTRGNLLGRLRRLDEAAATFERAIQERPEDASLHYNLAFALQSDGRFEEALAIYTRVLALRPQYPEALNNRGLTFQALGRPEEARRDYVEALTLRPDDIRALNNLGRCLMLLTRTADAIEAFDKALALAPDYAQAIDGIAIAYRILERNDELERVLQVFLARAPGCAPLWTELGVTLISLNKRAEAQECFARALSIAPGDAGILSRIGRAWLEAGDLDAAASFYEKAREVQPRNVSVLHGLTKVRRITTVDPTLAGLQALLPIQNRMEFGERASLHFALGKALADIGDNARSFDHYVEANRLQRLRRRYDEEAALGTMNRTAVTFSHEIVERCAGAGNDTHIPIFILGMPRSGSTLVEQILAAHSNVCALGELRAFHEAVRTMDAFKGAPFPAWLSTFEAPDCSFLADQYLARLGKIAAAHRIAPDFSEAPRLVDKMPGNFHYAGLIHLALPNARIIHTRRDSVDTCLSCFQMDFEGLPFTDELASLGRYYRSYERLMQSWHAVLPPDSILDVQYEELVTDFERVTRKIIAYCDLEWEDACLSFHKVDRSVRTSSAAQVRRPLYTTSIGKWRPSDDVLKPLLDGLEGRS